MTITINSEKVRRGSRGYWEEPAAFISDDGGGEENWTEKWLGIGLEERK
jgi:hypothetical protein